MIDLVFCGTFNKIEKYFLIYARMRARTHTWAEQRNRIKYYVRMFVCLFISLLVASKTNKQIKKVMAQSSALCSINADECWWRELHVCPKWLETHSYEWFNFCHSFCAPFFHLILLFLLFLLQTNIVTPSHLAWLTWLHKSVKYWRYNTHAHTKYLLLCALCMGCSTNSRTDELIWKYHHANMGLLISWCHCWRWCLFVVFSLRFTTVSVWVRVCVDGKIWTSMCMSKFAHKVSPLCNCQSTIMPPLPFVVVGWCSWNF